MSLPLASRCVLVTRAAHQAGKLSELLRALGAEPVEVPVLEFRPPASFEPLDEALRQIDAYDWLVLTSANAARGLSERAADLGIRLDQRVTMQVAAVGPGTASAAQKAKLTVTVLPEAHVAEGLVAALETETAGKRVLLARAAVARDVLPDALRAAGARVDVVDAYRNILPDSAPALLRQALEQRIDAATFTSSSSVTHLKEAAEKAGIAFPFAGVPAISIGPVTSRTLREFAWEPAAEAAPSDIPGLVTAVLQYFSR
ncbi:MAG TPA: uroporphyrinogen-III synthase [Terracidiphilus sp.]|jgi:uroporphyrinogen-III synthase/uroporphyrinogen III methyltransferase/synthase